MARLTRMMIALMFCLVFVGTTRTALASTLVIGSSTGPEAQFPFGFRDYAEDNGPTDLFQQLYAADSFGSDPILITALTVFIDSTSWRGHMSYTNEAIYLSTSPTTVGSPGTTLADNRGTDFTQVFLASRTIGFAGFPGDYFLDSCTDCTATELTFNITPFLYDPTNGDLLMEVRQSSKFSDTDHITFQAGSDPSVTAVDNLGGLFGGEVETHAGYGLRTEFTFDPVTTSVPEPSSLLLFGLGTLVLWSHGRTKRLQV